MNLTLGQKLALLIATLGVLSTGGAQLTDIIGPAWTKIVLSTSTLSMSVLSGWVAVLTGQGSQIAAVRDMPGVENILVNEKANPTLAAMAVDHTENKISAIPEAKLAVQATAAEG